MCNTHDLICTQLTKHIPVIHIVASHNIAALDHCYKLNDVKR